MSCFHQHKKQFSKTVSRLGCPLTMEVAKEDGFYFSFRSYKSQKSIADDEKNMSSNLSFVLRSNRAKERAVTLNLQISIKNGRRAV